ncbi:MAG: exo-alpha-sialidase [Acidobacteria bacterium]|nr:MAG: exo-alpha-sialidase [Acidobacteriota bacterium]
MHPAGGRTMGLSERSRRHVPLAFVLVLLAANFLAPAAPVPTPPVRVNDDASGPRQVEPMVAIDPLDPAHLVLVAEESENRDDTTTRVRVYVSDDGGQTWRTTGLLPGDNLRQANPSVSYCGDGVVYAAIQDINPTLIFQTYRSVDGGVTWERRTPAQQSPSAIDNPLLICDASDGPFRGRLYVRYGSAGKIYAVHSTDGAATWSDPVRLDAGGDNTSNFPGEMAIGPDSSLWVGFVKNLTPQEIRTAVSNDGGLTFEAPLRVGPVDVVPTTPFVDFRRTSRPSLDADRSGGTFHGGLHLVYGTWLDATSETDVQRSRRLPGVQGWVPPVRLNDDPPGNGRDQDFPSVRVDPLGTVRAIWMDRRNDPGTGLAEIFAASSHDAGGSFEPSFPVSAEPFPIPTGPGSFLGDHLGLATWAHVFLVVWPDRNRDDGDLLAAAVRDFPFEEVSDLRVNRVPQTELSWTSQDPVHGAATVYDVVSGSLLDLLLDGGFVSATCAAEDVDDSPWVDPRADPSAGDGTWYLVRSQQGSDAGSHGSSTAPPDLRLRLDVAPVCH